MATPKLQLLSKTLYDTDGTTTVWDFNFSGGYILPDHIKAYTESPSGLRTPITVTPAMLIGAWQLQITPALAAGDVLVIYRATPKDQPMVDFVDRGQVSEVALDTVARQAIFVAAEASDDVATSNIEAAAEAASDAAMSASSAAASAATVTSAAAAAAVSAGAAATSAADAATAASSLTDLQGSTTVGRAVLKAADAAAARATIGAAASGANSDITSLSGVISINGGQLSGNRNKLINGSFAINQRVVSGTVTLAANAYGHDYWKAGASGCTYTFATVNNVTTITITAGSLLQIINGRNLFSGQHTLSWVGTAQGRVGAGAYGASGLTVSVTGGTNTTIEFGTGTLSLAQFEPGTIPTIFEHRLNELQLCQQRYFKTYEPDTAPGTVSNATGYVSRFLEGNCNYATLSLSMPVAMEGIPNVTIYAGGTPTVGQFTRDGVNIPAVVQQAGRSFIAARANASATTVDQHITAHFVAVAGL